MGEPPAHLTDWRGQDWTPASDDAVEPPQQPVLHADRAVPDPGRRSTTTRAAYRSTRSCSAAAARRRSRWSPRPATGCTASTWRHAVVRDHGRRGRPGRRGAPRPDGDAAVHRLPRRRLLPALDRHGQGRVRRRRQAAEGLLRQLVPPRRRRPVPVARLRRELPRAQVDRRAPRRHAARPSRPRSATCPTAGRPRPDRPGHHRRPTSRRCCASTATSGVAEIAAGHRVVRPSSATSSPPSSGPSWTPCEPAYARPSRRVVAVARDLGLVVGDLSSMPPSYPPQLQAARSGRRVSGSERRHYDVAVVGAGPAGSAAALAARRRGARVLLLDRADFPRDKPCGDGIAAEALDVLAELGVTGVTDGYPPSTGCGWSGRAARRWPGRCRGRRTPCRGGSSTPGWSAAAVAAGADCAGTPCGGLRRRCRPGSHRRPVRRRDVVIGADGAGSVVRRALGHPANPAGTWPSRSAATRRSGRAPSRSSSPPSARWPAYAWSFPIGDGTANVGYGEVLRGVPLSRAYLLDRLDRLLPGSRTDRPARPPPAAVHPPAAAGPRPGAARRRRALADQPVHRRGHLLRRALRRAGRRGGRRRPAGVAGAVRRAPCTAGSAGTCGTPARRVADPAAAGGRRRGPGGRPRTSAVFDRMVDLGLGDGVFDLRTIGRIGAAGRDARPPLERAGAWSTRLRGDESAVPGLLGLRAAARRKAGRQAGAPARRRDVRRQPALGARDGVRRPQRRPPRRRRPGQGTARLVRPGRHQARHAVPAGHRQPAAPGRRAGPAAADHRGPGHRARRGRQPVAAAHGRRARRAARAPPPRR